MENLEFTNESLSPQRPVFLKVLCILTFVSAGFSSIISLLTPVMAEPLIEFMQNAPNYNEEQMADAIIYLRAGWGYHSLMCLLHAASLAGAVLMWKLKKIGFHVYALANLAALLAPTLMFSFPFSWFGIMLTAGFIAMYAMNLKHMNGGSVNE